MASMHFTRFRYFVSIVTLVALTWLSLGPAKIAGTTNVAMAASDPVIAAAGDIACDPTNANFNSGNGSSSSCRQKYTSDLLVNAGLAAVLPLGDNQYYCGGYQAWLQSYDLSWGRVKSITRPVVGNHEYLTSGGTDCTTANAGAAGYFKYFGSAAGNQGQGYYSYNIGSWHLIAINSNCGDAGGCSASSPQGQWLAADLAAHTNFCTLAYWHIPLFSSGGRASSNTQAIWQILYNNNVDVILNGHDHIYERFAPQTPSGTLDPVRGMREFIVGSGGANHTSLVTTAANSEVRNVDTYGVLKLTLHPTSYDWQFVPEAGKTFKDSGTGACHGNTQDTTPPTAPSNLTASAVASNQVKLNWTAGTDNVAVVGYKVLRNGTQIATASGTSYVDNTTQPQTTYSYSVVSLDGAGLSSGPSNTATVTTPTGPTVLSFIPAADAYIQLASPTTNYGSDIALFTDNSPVKHFLLKFNVSGIGGGQQVKSAKLRLFNVDASGKGGDFYRVSNNSWQESTVTWNNAPAADTTLLASLAAVSVNTWYEIDLSSVVTANGTYSLRVSSTSTDGADYSSKEGSNPPQLLVDVQTGPTNTPTTTPSQTQTPTRTPTSTPTLTATSTPSFTPTATNTATASATFTPTATATPSRTATATPTTTATATASYTSTATPTATPLALATNTASPTPTDTPVNLATDTPTATPTDPPLDPPTNTPTATSTPTLASGDLPTETATPTEIAGDVPTDTPTATETPTEELIPTPTMTDTPLPTDTPTSTATYTATSIPQPSATFTPSATASATATPSSTPTQTFTSTPTNTPVPITFVLTPSGDSYVDANNPTINYGASTQLRTDGSPIIRSYLRFNIQGVSGQITRVTLRVFANSSSTTGYTVSGVSNNTWTESTINYSNAPALGNLMGSSSRFTGPVWTSVDLTSFVTGNGTLNIALSTTSSTNISLASRESGANSPQLIIETVP